MRERERARERERQRREGERERKRERGTSEVRNIKVRSGNKICKKARAKHTHAETRGTQR
jgi:hypothetical protein